jgi:hypothetical protein
MVILGSFRRFCSSAGPVPRRFEPRDPLRAVSSSPVAAPAWLSSRFFSLNDAELGSIFVEMITIEGCNSLKDKKLATVFGWLRFTLFRRPFGTGCVLSCRGAMDMAALRPVNIAPVRTIDQYRNICAILTSDRRLSFRQTTLRPRAALPLRRRAGQLLSANFQRTSAGFLHPDFTTGSSDSCGLLRNLLSS